MENNLEENQDVNTESVDLNVTEAMRSYLYDTARWAKFIGICGLVITGFFVLIAFGINSIIGSGTLDGGPYATLGQLGSAALTIIFLFYALVIFFPSFYLYRFSVKTIKGVLYLDSESLTEGLKKLKSYFSFVGILIIIGILLNIMTMVSTLIVGSAMG
ncbi:DUF5362 family protein [Pedobacter flavus]|uniref:Glycerophosphoryl diester phosphodiesterase membrane domain-containing protein n=1 Tax=Pedobacter flavus TaxID=3113906 RepID=A0ABU7H1U1_9SPHI|nr:hypothetical protein [Pedobacter sp. VNH31]MEE1885225.1 hypothetical protein [Pedobacter sp. VNH31]